jgi:ABC-2 type transport system permease protein
MNSVHSGDVAGDLLKPMNIFTFWLARDLGRALAALLLRGVTMMVMFALVWELTVPGSGAQWLALLSACLLAWLVSFAWHFLVNLAAFWTPNARGIGRFGFLITWFLSGFLMPLRFFPEWVQRLASLTPFPHMVNTIVETYLGLLKGPALWQALLLQALWAVILVAAGQLILRRAVRRLVILGG